MNDTQLQTKNSPAPKRVSYIVIALLVWVGSGFFLQWIISDLNQALGHTEFGTWWMLPMFLVVSVLTLCQCRLWLKAKGQTKTERSPSTSLPAPATLAANAA